MSSIQPKRGKCIDCGPDSAVTQLIAGRCNSHYWRYRGKVNAGRRKASGVDVNAYEDKRALDNWYLFQISHMPAKCENCGETLYNFAPWALRSFVAHIVEKRNFESVKLHVLNRVFLCLICHTNYDNWGNDKVVQMPAMGVIIERFLIFRDQIAAEEYDYLPPYFMELMQHD